MQNLIKLRGIQMTDNDDGMSVQLVEMGGSQVSAYSHLTDLLNIQDRVKDQEDLASYVDALFRYELNLALTNVRVQCILADQELEKVKPKVKPMAGNMGKVIPMGVKNTTDEDNNKF
jgi:hypothetical protein